jgi:choline dehydrogenase
VTGLFRSEPSLNRPDLQVYFQAAGYRIEPGAIVFNREPSIQYSVALTHPKGRGHVRLRSSDVHAPPEIQLRLLDSEEDMAALRRGLRLGRKLMHHEPISRYIVREMLPGDNVQSDATLDEFIRAESEPLLHGAGTCRMGTDEQSVVDPGCRVRGIDGLRVADLSVVPDIPGCNTNALAIVIGEKVSDLVKAGARG